MNYFKRHVVSIVLVSFTSAQLCLSVGCGSPGETDSAGPIAHDQTGYDGQSLMKAVFFNVGPASSKIGSVWANRPSAMAGKSAEQVATMLDNAAEAMGNANYSADAVQRVREQAASMRAGKGVLPAPLSSEEVNVASDGILIYMDQADPTFFNRFATELQSGDPLRVENALEEGAHRMLDAQSALSQSGGSLHTESVVVSAPGGTGLPTSGGSLPTNKGTIAHIGGGLGGTIGKGADDLTVVDTAVAIYAVAVVAVFAVAVAAVRGPEGGGGEFAREQYAAQIANAYRL